MPIDGQRGLVEALIHAARERGDFDNLPSHGKPLELDDLSGLNAEQRFDALVLRTVGELPLEASLAREIRECRKALASARPDEPNERLQQLLRTKLDELIATLKARRLSTHPTRHT